MKKLLITGFDPFGGQKINPAWETVRSLPRVIGDHEVYPLQVPTEFARCHIPLFEAADRLQPDLVLCVGQAGGRREVTAEYAAINLMHASMPDNAGFAPRLLPVEKGGREAFFTPLPLHTAVETLRARGLPVSVSYSAGVYVCNTLYYRCLSRFCGTATRAGFIHVPFFPCQAKEGVPALEPEEIAGVITGLIGLF